MRRPKAKDRGRLIAAALQEIPCDLTVENVRLVNMITGEVYPAAVDVLDGCVVRLREAGEETALPSATVYDGKGAYLLPGLIDTHMHVESTMMLPENLSRAAVPLGTTTVCTDPHEIGNVMGVEGVRFMLQNAQKSALRQYSLAPSCVPAVPGKESSGAVFGAAEVGALLDTEDVVGIAEIMDVAGVVANSERMRSIIGEGLRRGAFLQGHAPFVQGKELAAYRLGGPESDHESNLAAEVREKLRNGIHINLRASSLLDALSTLLKGMEGMRWYDYVSFCTDDVHVKDILKSGHVNKVVGQAIAAGLDPLEAYRMATLNAARELGFDDLGALAPGYIADMQLLRELDGGVPEAVFIEGRLVAQNGAYLGADGPGEPANFPNTVNIPQLAGPDDLRLKVPDPAAKTARVLVMQQTENKNFVRQTLTMELPVVDGCIDISGAPELSYVCIANRYGGGGKTVALYKDYGITGGAFASTVSHDSHNLTLVYRSPEDAYKAACTLKECGGGMCMVEAGVVTALLPLPFGGLMSPLEGPRLAAEVDRAEQVYQRLCGAGASMLHSSVLSLPVMSGIVVTDFGVVNGATQTFVDIFDVS